MKRFTVSCNFGQEEEPFDVYIGEASPKRHPLYYQSIWLEKERGGEIPTQVIESFDKIREISLEYKYPFEDYCVYNLRLAEEKKEKGATVKRRRRSPALKNRRGELLDALDAAQVKLLLGLANVVKVDPKAFEAFVKANSRDKMQQAIVQFPFMTNQDFIAAIKQATSLPLVPAEHWRALSWRFAWLRQIANQQK